MSFQEQLTQSQGTGEDDNLKTRSILHTLENQGYRKFLEAAEAAGLSGLLRGPGNHTVLAVRDDAFTGPGADPDKRAELVNRLVVRNKVTVADMRLAKHLKPMTGDPLPVDWNGGDVRVAGMRIRRADLTCTNGVIHEMEGIAGEP